MPVSVGRHNLVRLREELNLTQSQLAGRIGRSFATIRALETGSLKLSKKLARLIADVTGADADWLLRNDLAEPMPKLESQSSIELTNAFGQSHRAGYIGHLFDRLFIALERLDDEDLRARVQARIQRLLDESINSGHQPEARPLKIGNVGTFEFLKKHPLYLEPDLASWTNIEFLVKDAYRLAGEPNPEQSRRRSTPRQNRASPAPGGQRKSRPSSASRRAASPN